MSDAFSERMRLIRFRRKKERPRFRDELKIIPRWLMWICAVLYIIALAVVLAINFSGSSSDIRPHDLADQPFLSALALGGIVTGCGIVISIWLMAIGYVYRDAKRRDMNPALWTILCMLLSWPFFAIGFVLYFQVREPLPFPCPRCSAMVGARFNFCPNCKCNLHPSCSNCKREVAETDKFCPYCAHDLSDSERTRLPLEAR